ncbi:hypothetical protein [Limosilactobacillus fermentum]
MQVEDALNPAMRYGILPTNPLQKKRSRNRALSSANAVLGQLRALAGVRGDRPVADPNSPGCLDLAAQRWQPTRTLKR